MCWARAGLIGKEPVLGSGLVSVVALGEQCWGPVSNRKGLGTRDSDRKEVREGKPGASHCGKNYLHK